MKIIFEMSPFKPSNLMQIAFSDIEIKLKYFSPAFIN